MPPRPEEPDERRLVLLLERDDRKDAEAPGVADEDLLPRPDHHRVGRLAEVVPVGRVEPVPEHVSSVPGPDGDTEATSEVEWQDVRPGQGA
jgi:hypothetical protein